MKYHLYLLQSSIWITLVLSNAEALRYKRSDSSELFDNENGVTDSQLEDDEGLFNKDTEDVTLKQNDTKDAHHNHQGLARWGEGNPYQADSVTTTQGTEQGAENDEEKLTNKGTSDAEVNEEDEEGEMKDDKTEAHESEQPDSEKNKEVDRDSESHHHEGLVHWGSSGEKEENEASVTSKLFDEDSQDSDENDTSEYESESLSANVTLNKQSIESTPLMTTVSTTTTTTTHIHDHHHDNHQHENHSHHHEHNDEEGNNSDNLSDKQHVDHLVDPLLSDFYLGNNQSSLSTQIDNETDISKIDSACRRCIKWQQLHSTLPCILYPLNFDMPEQVNQTKLVYIHAMRRIVAQINNGLNELLLDLEL